MIIVCEPNLVGLEHTPINASVLEILHLGHPEKQIIFFAENGHLKGVEELLSNSTRAWVEFRPMNVAARRAEFSRRFIPTFLTMRKCFSMALNQEECHIILTSGFPATIYAAELLQLYYGHAVSVQIVLHGALVAVDGWRSKNPIKRFIDMRGALKFGRSPNTQYILLEPAIQESLFNVFPEIIANTAVLDHPVAERGTDTEMSQPSRPIQIGFVGLAADNKGFGDFLELARRGRSCFGTDIEFHAIGAFGHEKREYDLSQLATVPTNEKLSGSAYADSIRRLHYICLPLDKAHYSLCASGTFLDAVSFLKPPIVYDAPVIKRVFEQFGDIGFLAGDIEGAWNSITRIMRDGPVGYPHQVAALTRLRESRTPSALVGKYVALTQSLISRNRLFAQGKTSYQGLGRVRRGGRSDLPLAAQRLDANDRQGLTREDSGAERAIQAGIRWLMRAQAMSATQDGGVSRHFSLIDGWSDSYPETTGYIIPTLLDCAPMVEDKPAIVQCVQQMLDFLLKVQLPDGAFYGGMVNQSPERRATFNTGQILLGLVAGCRAFKSPHYLTSMHRAAEWLRDTQDPDGCWRRFPTPFAVPGDKTYETHVSWGLFEADRIAPGLGYADAGLRQVRWALTKQSESGWMDYCCLRDPQRPLTHTLGYALRGIIEAFRFSGEQAYLSAAQRTADAIIGVMHESGWIPGRVDRNWHSAASWSCLTGSVQLSSCWLLLFEITGLKRYLDAGLRANSFVRRTLLLEGSSDLVGAVRGSFPISGEYAAFEFPNWSTKFLIDACILEMRVGQKQLAHQETALAGSLLNAVGSS